ncbi:MAG TPA: acyltransferase [Thermomicrobiaceae bacterium]|nr:acyltransferase [Thermomicrobiaceae bacterium]
MGLRWWLLLCNRDGAAEYYIARLLHYGRLFRRSLHLKYVLANTLAGLLPDFFSGSIRTRLYRRAGFAVGHGAFLMGNLDLSSAVPGFYDNLVIGPGVTIADHVRINLDARVTIGRNVAIAPHVLIFTGSHKTGPGSARLGAPIGLPVTIEDGAWVRLGAIILPGVTVGRGSIVAAGAVVMKDVPPNSYVEGNPAEVVHRLPWADR